MGKLRTLLRAIQAGATALFFLQGVRVLYPGLYGAMSVADMEGAFPAAVMLEIVLTLAALLLPLLAVIFNANAIALAVVAVMVALGRVGMAFWEPQLTLYSVLVVVGFGGLNWAMQIRSEPQLFASGLLLGLIADQCLRGAGDTLDLSIAPDWLPYQAALSGAVVVISILLARRRAQETEAYTVTIWGGIGLGAAVFFELTLLAMPNAVAHWAGSPVLGLGMSYEVMAPIMLAATALPLAPVVRELAGRFVGMFDSQFRGWLWMVLMALALVVGNRFSGVAAGVMLALAQLMLGLMLWWIAEPTEVGKRNWAGLGIATAWLVFLALSAGSLLTFTYAYTVPAFRGQGLALYLAATVLLAMPAILGRGRIPWQVMGDEGLLSIIMLIGAAALAVGGWRLVVRPLPAPQQVEDRLIVGSYNIHAGFSQDLRLSLEGIAQTIAASNADVVMLQEVDAGRLTSYGVDEPLWLARRLGMRPPIYQQTNERLTGLAIITRLELMEADSVMLSGTSEQTAALLARLRLNEEQTLNVYTTWLQLPSAPGGEEAQVRQLAEAVGYMGAVSPLVFGGTFNNVPTSTVYTQTQMAGLVDPFAVLGLETPPTYPALHPQHQLDYIWLRGVAPTNARVLESAYSDHRMIIAEIEWR